MADSELGAEWVSRGSPLSICGPANQRRSLGPKTRDTPWFIVIIASIIHRTPPPLPPPPSLCRVHRLSEPFFTRVVFVLIWWHGVHFVINTFYDDFLYVRFINKINFFLNHDLLIKNNRWKRWAMHYLLLLQTYLFQYSTVIVTASMYWNSVVHCDVKWSAKKY